MPEMMNDKWKSEFYARYSTFFGRKISKDTYDQFVPFGRHIVKKLFPSNKNSRILDMGCGIGGFVRVFETEGYLNLEGVDISREDVDYAHAHGVMKVRQGELFETLREAHDGMYDVVLYLDVLEHFEHGDVLHILKETYRILSPQGRIIIHVPNGEGLFGSRIRYSDFTHELAFTNHSLAQIARYAGFDLFRCYEDQPLVHGPVSFIRRVLWVIMTFPFRILFAVESGTFSVRLSQNILFAAIKS